MAKYEIAVATPGGIKKAVVRFTELLEAHDGNSLNSEIGALLGQGYKDWEFDLEPLPACDSTCLGMWIALNALIASRGGRLMIAVPDDSPNHRLFVITKLDRILNLKKV